MESRPSLRLGRVSGIGGGTLVVLALLATTPVSAVGQEEAQERPEANPADVESPDAIVEAGFEAISGAPGERDWERFRSLFHPQAHLVVTYREDGEPRQAEVTLEKYIPAFKKQYGDTAVYESVVHTVTERFGDIAHVWVTYEARHSRDADPYRRGIDSFQLWYDGDRWWIRNLIAHAEREGAQLPEEYGG